MGLTVVDAGVLIGFLDNNDSHHLRATEALAEAYERQDRLTVPASALAETLVGPAGVGPKMINIVLSLLVRLPMQVATQGEDVAVAAARIRAAHPSLKLPDALVVATAQVTDADYLLTTDRRWPPATRLDLRAVISIV